MGGIFGGGGGDAASESVQKSTEAQLAGLKKATIEQQRQFEDYQKISEPFRESSQQALATQLGILGLGPTEADVGIGTTEYMPGDYGGYRVDVEGNVTKYEGPGQIQSDLADIITSTPGYEYAQRRAEKAALRGAAATGGLGGGNILRQLQSTNAQLASSALQNYYNQLGFTSGTGLSSYNQLAGQGMLGQQQLANINQQAQTARLSGL